MSALLGALILGLAARGGFATLCDLGRVLDLVGAAVGRWARKLTLARDKKRDHRRNGVLRLQAEVVAMQTSEAITDRAELRALRSEVEALRAESAARGNPADAGARGKWYAS